MKRSRLIFFCHTAFTVPFGLPFFTSYSLYPLSILASGGATGLRGGFPDHPRPFHLTFTDIHNNIYTPMGALPDGTRTRADLAVVVERVLILPSTTLRQPRGDIHTHPWPGEGSFLGKNPPPSVGFELTRIGTATSEYFLR
jgi:hypothetical protein